MAKYAPHLSLYKIVDIIKKIIDWVFWLIFFLSVLPTILNSLKPGIAIDDYINVANIILILLFFVLDIVVDYVLLPQAGDKRRDDFIDNSFGTKFSTNSSVEYFDNEELTIGIYKAAANLFENCFFTLSLANQITIKRIVLPALVLLTIWALAFYGFKEMPFALSLLQVLFSTNILGSLIRHLILLNRLNTIQDGWINIFQIADFRTHPDNYRPLVYRNWLRYEALHSKIPANIPIKVFNKLNPKLTEDWKKLKIKYDIY